MQVPTGFVIYKSSGQRVLINVSDFDPNLHEISPVDYADAPSNVAKAEAEAAAVAAAAEANAVVETKTIAVKLSAGNADDAELMILAADAETLAEILAAELVGKNRKAVLKMIDVRRARLDEDARVAAEAAKAAAEAAAKQEGGDGATA